MTRTVDRKLTVWMAGYYDDFMGARTVPDDLNTPSQTYYKFKSHHGNPMNGWANLNPRYAYALVERYQLGNNALTAANGGKFNSGINEWLGYDQNRRSGGNKYEGITSLQYPDSHSNANRQRYANSTNFSSNGITDEAYLRFCYGFDTSRSYYAAVGDTDSTFGRDDMKYPALDDGSGDLDDNAGEPHSASAPTKVVRTHTAGSYVGMDMSKSQIDDVTRLLYPIQSPSGQSFLTQEIYYNNTSTYSPILAYDGTLNSKGDGDIFTIRIAPILVNSNATPTIKLKVGCEGTAWGESSGNDTSYSASAVELEITHADFIQKSAVTWNTGDYNAPNMEDVWIDYDFVFDYNAGTYDLYKNGTKVVSAGSIGNKADGNQFEAADMYGWELQAKSNAYKFTVLIDRVGLIRPLNDHPSGADMPPAVKMNYQSGSNSISTLSVDVIDDDQQLALMPMFNQNSYADWSLLMFRNACDRPIWRGSITGMNYKKSAVERTPTISIQASDYFSLMDRQIPTWEMGTSDDGTQTSQVAYNRSESQNKLDVYYMGATRNQRANATLGFNEVVDGSGTFTKHLDSRMRNRTAHPIQMYTDEDVIGPNDAYNDWDDAITAGHATSDAAYRSIHGRWMQDLPKSAWFRHMFARIKGQSSQHALSANFTKGSTSMTVAGVSEAFEASKMPISIEMTDSDGFVDSGVVTAASISNTQQVYAIQPTWHSRRYKDQSGNNILYNTDGGYYTYDIYFSQSGMTNPANTQIKFSHSNMGTFTSGVRSGEEIMNGLQGMYFLMNVTAVNKAWSIAGSGTTTLWKATLAKRKDRPAFYINIFQPHLNTPYEEFKHYAPSNNEDFPTVSGVGYSYVKGRRGEHNRVTINGHTAFRDVAKYANRDGEVLPVLVRTASQSMKFEWGTPNLTLPATNFFQRSHNSGKIMRVREFDDDYKHLWILWADARNDGTANADAGYRKQEFGLLAPYAGNYELTLGYAEENISNTQERQTFTDLNIGSDINLWELGATDPITGSAWSAVSGGSNSESASKYHNWEDQAGAFVILDGSRFFNLNTHSNNGKAGQTSGGRKEIGDYLVETEGFPVLIDNYWARAHANGGNIDESASWNSNYKFLNSVPLQLANDIKVGDGLIFFSESNKVHIPTGIGSGTSGVAGQIVSNGKKKVWHFNLETDELDAYASIGTSASAGFKIERNSDVSSVASSTGEFVITIRGGSALINCYKTLRTGQIINIKGVSGNLPTLSGGGVIDGEYSIIGDGTIVLGGSPYQYIKMEFEDTTEAVTTAGFAQMSLPGAYGLSALAFLGVPQPGATSPSTWNGSGYGGANSAEYLIQAYGTHRADVEINLDPDASSNSYDDAVAYVGLANIFPMRLLMELNGFVKNKGSLTYFDNDKFRVTWMDCLTETWLKQTKLNGIWDINTVPNSKKMSMVHTSAGLPGQGGVFTTPGLVNSSGTVTATSVGHGLETGDSIVILGSAACKSENEELLISSITKLSADTFTFARATADFDSTTAVFGVWRKADRIDSFGSVSDNRNTSISNVFSNTEASSGIGDDYSIRSTFSWLMGRDSAPSYRPTYSNGFSFNQNNLRVANLSTQSRDQVTNVRVFYGGSTNFVDYPSVSLNSTPRWEIITQNEIQNEAEALAVAKAEYEKLKSAPLSITAEVTRFSDSHNFYGDTGVMLDDARYGYISDPSRTIMEAPFSTNPPRYSWISQQSGNLFPGRVNALDGNDGSTNTPNDSSGKDSWDDSYHFYGANSISYAVQIVHIPKGMPKTTNRTAASNYVLGDGQLRVFVGTFPDTGDVSDDGAKFAVHLIDYDWTWTSSNTTRLNPNPIGVSSCVIDGNGFYEIAIPSSYWPDQAGNERIVISVNYDYLMALRNNRCGSSNKHKMANQISGISGSYTGNNDSIFPLGCRKFGQSSVNLETAYWSRLAEWFGPRLHITDDINFVPSTTLSFTESSFDMNSENLVVKGISWNIDGRNTERVQLTLERDVSRAAKDFRSYILPPTTKGGTGGGNTSGRGSGGGSQKPDVPPQGGDNNPSDGTSGGGYGDFAPGTVVGDGLSPINQSFSGRPDSAKINTDRSFLLGGNALTNALNNKVKGVMNFNNDSVTGGDFAVLGQTKPAAAPRDTGGVDGFDSFIAPVTGDAIISSEGMVFPGLGEGGSTYSVIKGRMRIPSNAASSELSITAKSTMMAGSGQALLYVTLFCLETGDSQEQEVTVAAGENETVSLFTGTLQGAEVSGNTIEMTIERTPNEGTDTAQYGAVTINSVQMGTDRRSVAGSGQSNSLSY